MTTFLGKKANYFILFFVLFVPFILAEDNFRMDEGLDLTLSASEPEILSLSNIDIDHLGRVWACEVVNYGPNQGKRAEVFFKEGVPTCSGLSMTVVRANRLK